MSNTNRKSPPPQRWARSPPPDAPLPKQLPPPAIPAPLTRHSCAPHPLFLLPSPVIPAPLLVIPAQAGTQATSAVSRRTQAPRQPPKPLSRPRLTPLTRHSCAPSRHSCALPVIPAPFPSFLRRQEPRRPPPSVGALELPTATQAAFAPPPNAQRRLCSRSVIPAASARRPGAVETVWRRCAARCKLTA